MVLVDVLVALIVVILSALAFVFVFILWLKDKQVLKKKYRELAAHGKEEMDESPLVG